MFQDTKDELKRLEEELLAAEDGLQDTQSKQSLKDEDLQDLLNIVEDLDDEELQDLLNMVGDLEKEEPEDTEEEISLPEFPADFHAYNTDTTDEDLEAYSEEVREEEDTRKNTGLIKLLLGLLIGLFGVLVLWMLKLYGVLG